MRDILLVSADISTHAPAGGATRSSRCRKRLNPFLLTPLREGRLGCVLVFAVQEHISTHAPAGGATKVAVPVVLAFGYFYSRPCGRGDESSQRNIPIMIISTHAPAGGATGRSCS